MTDIIYLAIGLFCVVLYIIIIAIRLRKLVRRMDAIRRIRQDYER